MSNNAQSGKGDKPRPVDKKKYNKNWEEIDWKKKPSQSSKPA